MPDSQEVKEQTNVRSTTPFEEFRRLLFVLLALTSVGCAIARIKGVPNVDREVLIFLAMAGVFLVLERIKKLSVGKDGISYETGEQIKEQLTTVRQVAEENQRALTDGVGGKTQPTPVLEEAANLKVELPPVKYDYDPQKGRFLGVPNRNGRRLSAEVLPAKGSPGNYEVILKVESEDGSNPLKGDVTFYLHNTFKRSVRAVPVRNGVAKLELLAYGAFTVGAVADRGQTLLELDLAEDERFPEKFRRS